MFEFVFLDIFMVLFVTMGPLKVVLVYANLTRDLEPATRRKVAIKAVVIAFIIGLLFIVGGKFLMDLFHFSLGALSIAGGAILFVFALRMVLAGGGESEHGAETKDAERIAGYPLAMPLMATPIGITALTVASATFSNDTEALIGIAVALMVVMAVNLVILIGEGTILKYIDPQIINIAERILGILVAALAVQTMLNGLQELGLIALKSAGH